MTNNVNQIQIVILQLEKLLSNKMNKNYNIMFSDCLTTDKKVTFTHCFFSSETKNIIQVLIISFNNTYMAWMPINCGTNDLVDYFNAGDLKKNYFESPLNNEKFKDFKIIDLTKDLRGI